MRRILMLLLLPVAAACGPSRGHLVVDWTFSGGGSCLDVGVATIQVDIAHEVLTPNQFACQESNGQVNIGADLGTYITGRYDLTITGFDANGTITHQQTQTLAVHGGENAYTIDVPQVAPSSFANASLTWTFAPGAMSCAAANIDQVTIFVDPDANGLNGINAGTVACSTMGTDGASIEQLTPGTHSFAIYGSRAGTIMYRTHNPPSAPFVAGLTTPVSVSAEPLP